MQLPINAGHVSALEKTNRFPEADHVWSIEEVNAVRFALASKRPLLVRGEPGSGKTQLARAVAAELKVELFAEVIHPRYEPTELLYRFDAVKRLADAQSGRNAIRADASYTKKGPLWQAWNMENGAVLLIDEIDKCDSDLPNSLLDVLGNRSFVVPGFIEPIEPKEAPPFVLITTNEDRELPAAFVRRCAVLNLNPMKGLGADEFEKWMIARAHAKRSLRGVIAPPPATNGASGAREEKSVYQLAAAQVYADRLEAASLGYKVGLSPQKIMRNKLSYSKNYRATRW
jgi:MoxR-like ATPase